MKRFLIAGLVGLSFITSMGWAAGEGERPTRWIGTLSPQEGIDKRRSLKRQAVSYTADEEKGPLEPQPPLLLKAFYEEGEERLEQQLIIVRAARKWLEERLAFGDAHALQAVLGRK